MREARRDLALYDSLYRNEKLEHTVYPSGFPSVSSGSCTYLHDATYSSTWETSPHFGFGLRPSTHVGCCRTTQGSAISNAGSVHVTHLPTNTTCLIATVDFVDVTA